MFAADEGLSGCWYEGDIFVEGDEILGGRAAGPLGGGPTGGIDLGGAPNEGPGLGCGAGW